jgi:A/G-specific adenine glycosylase
VERRHAGRTAVGDAVLVDPWPGAVWKRSLHRRLLAWFAHHRRDLPWRRTRDPYRVWVSEIMLQQTQVATVVPYYERFVAALPTLAALAAAPEEQVLRLWEGLGYYRRARQLHRAAQVCFERHGGQVPRDVAALRALPGIGRYTAGAILSIAHDERQPILEANTLRVLSRLLAYEGDPRSTAGQRLLWQAAEAALPPRSSGEFNQALMELGALVCLPQPRCLTCPVATRCAARLRNREQSIPPPARAPHVEDAHEAAVVVRRRKRVLLVRRRDGQRWAGMWDFPRFPLSACSGTALEAELDSGVAAAAGVRISAARKLTTLRHGVTRFRIRLDCFEAQAAAQARGKRRGDLRWAALAELESLPMSATGRKLSRMLLAERA